MTGDYAAYEEACARIREQNAQLLDLFEQDLMAKGLGRKTIDNHIRNVEFYLDDYLCYEEPQTFEKGTGWIGEFLGYFFIRKCMWASPSSIRSNAASIRKFYKSMLEHGKIEKEDYDDLCATIKENMEDWQDSCRAFDNGNLNWMNF